MPVGNTTPVPVSIVYLVPSVLHEEALETIPHYVLPVIESCTLFFVENERTTRRFFKSLWRRYRPGETFDVDRYRWITIGKDRTETEAAFRAAIRAAETIGIISEAGAPGVADPGQRLVSIAHEMNATVKPCVGPSSILLALMASGLEGQHFQFHGYLPIDESERSKVIRELEQASQKKRSTQIFIETPYRNNQLLDALLKNCNASTKICIASLLTSPDEWTRTQTVRQWKQSVPDLHKKPTIFLMLA